jgi:hypothetical protein
MPSYKTCFFVCGILILETVGPRTYCGYEILKAEELLWNSLMFNKQSLYSLTRHYGSEWYRILVECIWCEKYTFSFNTVVGTVSIV